MRTVLLIKGIVVLTRGKVRYVDGGVDVGHVEATSILFEELVDFS